MEADTSADTKDQGGGAQAFADDAGSSLTLEVIRKVRLSSRSSSVGAGSCRGAGPRRQRATPPAAHHHGQGLGLGPGGLCGPSYSGRGRGPLLHAVQRNDGLLVCVRLPVVAACPSPYSPAQVFHLPSTEAATALGIAHSRLKRFCRAAGVQRWPQRKLASLTLLRQTLEGDPKIAPDDKRVGAEGDGEGAGEGAAGGQAKGAASRTSAAARGSPARPPPAGARPARGVPGTGHAQARGEAADRRPRQTQMAPLQFCEASSPVRSRAGSYYASPGWRWRALGVGRGPLAARNSNSSIKSIHSGPGLPHSMPESQQEQLVEHLPPPKALPTWPLPAQQADAPPHPPASTAPP